MGGLDCLQEPTDSTDRWGKPLRCDWIAGGAVLVLRSSGPDGTMDTCDDLAVVKLRPSE